jgi:hypothetical protein
MSTREAADYFEKLGNGSNVISRKGFDEGFVESIASFVAAPFEFLAVPENAQKPSKSGTIFLAAPAPHRSNFNVSALGTSI